MNRLDLDPRTPVVLPASKFPDRADKYICDNCKRDLTEYLHRGRAHVWPAMGPERCICVCGQTYLTGATEWDHFGDGGRKRRTRDTFGLGILFSLMASIPGLIIYLALRFIFGLREAALIVALIITVLPFFLMQITFWPGVFASMRRTRFGRSIAFVRD